MAERYEVLVIGGGMAGCAAALAAAREGAATCVIERAPTLGGNATRAMVGPWQGFHTGRLSSGELPLQVVGGIAQEFVDDLETLGATPGHLVDPIGFAGSITPVDSEMLKLYLPRKLAEAGVAVVLGESVTSQHLGSARQIVDASGSAAAAAMLGAPTVTAVEPQPMSWLFTMGGVDTEEIRTYQLAHPEEFVHHPRLRDLRPDYIGVSGFFKLVRVARQTGELDIPRDRLLFFSTPRPGEVLVNSTRIAANHPEPRVEGLRQIRELADWLPHRVPGFARAGIARIADDVGQRESARLKGRALLTAQDVKEARESAEAIARGSYPIDIHDAHSDGLTTQDIGGRGYYDIPLGCLQSPRVPRLVCAGRCISADPVAFSSVRVLPTAMATGQAAGMIAAWDALEKKRDLSACLSHVSLV